MEPLVDSTALLADPATLRDRVAADGYLFLPGLLPRAEVAAVRAEVLPMGVVPYDNMTLPIVSPSGRFLATQSGVDPTWETILAEPGASVPQATVVEIYELVRGSRSPSQVAWRPLASPPPSSMWASPGGYSCP